ncbi:hypothetical protein RB195_005763 [Necator americanus]|uniref:Zinc knuckle n=1 Tax=Necator americanus TaxID=51031 RepID=A0ABR1BPH0_NECAM
MSGPATLRSHKGLLTRYRNCLTRLLDEQSPTQPDDVRIDQTSIQKLRRSSFVLSATKQLVTDALNNFTSALDDLQEPLTEENDKQVTQYLDKAHAVLERAQERIISIEGQLLGPSQEETTVVQMRTAAQIPKLPAIPIPTFTGKIWEFSNFWTLFEANVHQQPLTKLQKFNHLVNTLRGEARELIRRYPITESNYDHTVDLLHSKYDNETALIGNLPTRLETAKAESKNIKAQRRLLETIIPIITQLQELRVNLDGSYLSQKILAKFSTTLQRQALQEYVAQNTQESDWNMSRTLSILDNLISTEEKINEMVDRNEREDATPTYQSDKYTKSRCQKIPSSTSQQCCMFCYSNTHKSVDCNRMSSPSDRRTFLLNDNRCLNCGREGHFLAECISKGCRNCNGQKHHHTICPRYAKGPNATEAKGPMTQKPPRDWVEQTLPQPQKLHAVTSKLNRQKSEKKIARANPVQTHGTDFTDIISETCPSTTVLHNAERDKGSHHVLLLTGVAKVWDEPNKLWKEVESLFDTGADQSFISQRLADELGLECTKQQEFLMYTFGTEKPHQHIVEQPS